MKFGKMLDTLSKSLREIGYEADASELKDLARRKKLSGSSSGDTKNYPKHKAVEETESDDFEVVLDENANFTKNDLLLINDFTRTLDDKDPKQSLRMRRNIMNTLHRRRMR